MISFFGLAATFDLQAIHLYLRLSHQKSGTYSFSLRFSPA